jgi:hypothetical protein
MGVEERTAYVLGLRTVRRESGAAEVTFAVQLGQPDAQAELLAARLAEPQSHDVADLHGGRVGGVGADDHVRGRSAQAHEVTSLKCRLELSYCTYFLAICQYSLRGRMLV